MPALATKKDVVHGLDAGKAAIELCLTIAQISPVRIQCGKDGEHIVCCSSGEGGVIEKKLSQFISGTGHETSQKMHENVLSELKEKAGITGERGRGMFSFIAPGSQERPCTYHVLVESFNTDEGKALALTVDADDSEELPEPILYRSTD